MNGRLSTKWSMELSQDLAKINSVNFTDAITDSWSKALMEEIDRDIIEQMKSEYATCIPDIHDLIEALGKINED